MKTTQACNYAVLRFRPYRETGEFVNLGVVLGCAATRLFEFKVETQRIKRVTSFFPELIRETFIEARVRFCEELRRLKRLMADSTRVPDGPTFDGVFRELVRPREAVMRFGEVGTVLTEDPLKTLEDLFERHINRQFAQAREYQETVMKRRLKAILDAHQLLSKYRTDETVGNEEFHVRFPLVSNARTEAGIARRAIKPLDLDRDEPTRIYEHGDIWIKRVQRLKQIGQLPEGLLFALREPTVSERRIKAAKEIRAELARQDVRVLTFEDSAAAEAAIVEFAAVEARQ